MFSLLLFMFCFFLGSMAMFFYSLKKRESQFRSLNEEHAQIRVLLRALESRLDNMEKYLGQCSVLENMAIQQERSEDGQGEEVNVEGKNTEHDPLLHLSFEDPDKLKCGKGDPNLELLMDEQEGKSMN